MRCVVLCCVVLCCVVLCCECCVEACLVCVCVRVCVRSINHTQSHQPNPTQPTHPTHLHKILHVEVFDYDTVNASGAATFQIWKGIVDSFGAKEFMVRIEGVGGRGGGVVACWLLLSFDGVLGGRATHAADRLSQPRSQQQKKQGRCAVRLAPLIAAGDGAEEEMWFPLGRGEWTNPMGTVRVLCARGRGEGGERGAPRSRGRERARGGLREPPAILGRPLSSPLSPPSFRSLPSQNRARARA